VAHQRHIHYRTYSSHERLENLRPTGNARPPIVSARRSLKGNRLAPKPYISAHVVSIYDMRDALRTPSLQDPVWKARRVCCRLEGRGFRLREKYGFTFHGARAVDETSEFIWILGHIDTESFESANRRYYKSDARKSLDPDRDNPGAPPDIWLKLRQP
jgi:hypothetical protein